MSFHQQKVSKDLAGVYGRYLFMIVCSELSFRSFPTCWILFSFIIPQQKNLSPNSTLGPRNDANMIEDVMFNCSFFDQIRSVPFKVVGKKTS